LAQLNTLDISALTAAERLMLVFDLRALKPRMDVTAYLTKLTSDSEPEAAKAAGEAIQAK